MKVKMHNAKFSWKKCAVLYLIYLNWCISCFSNPIFFQIKFFPKLLYFIFLFYWFIYFFLDFFVLCFNINVMWEENLYSIFFNSLPLFLFHIFSHFHFGKSTILKFKTNIILILFFLCTVSSMVIAWCKESNFL